ncbi:MAG: DUF2064 domain-containing protein, partial [Rhodomicrobium sp.]|nr:DUF2064 domain-containing protein [Rhodomicrobium sp.]
HGAGLQGMAASGCARASRERRYRARMERLLRGQGHVPVVLIGSDIPGVAPAHIAAAFAKLGGCDAVFGPAEDGGFWLVGLKPRPRLEALFGDVRWSTEHALADTLTRLDVRKIGFAARLSDVDDARDYALAAHQGACVTRLR